ncbi:hypothetical protein SAMN05421759_104216 [Roseivivax lentus]|uniref:Uncharacterized protein n=1 Tax=Roseivivax lentus TaxID=633194 RepID=A0A1N7MDA4_9RHOB|nr:hypothetical protein [Roseivivax lentus]SIS84093.1 hypothetical protein SAMN05421759_104216 [Roseivivax lentus]
MRHTLALAIALVLAGPATATTFTPSFVDYWFPQASGETVTRPAPPAEQVR